MGKRPSTDTNVTRAPYTPLWEGVQTHMTHAMAPYKSPIEEGVITLRMRENKQLEYKQQVIGNLGGFLGVKGVPPEDMQKGIKTLVKEITDHLSMDVPHPIMKSYTRARERWGQS